AAALLREAHEVEHRRVAPLEMRGHRDQRTDRDDTGSADPGDQEVVRAVPRPRCGIGQRVELLREPRRVDRGARAARAATADRNEAGTEAVRATVVLVARRLVDATLAPERSVDRDDR